MKGRFPVIASFLRSGCATTYYNPHITDAGALQRQRIIDEGYCTRVASGSVPMPQVRHYQSGLQNYQVTGNAHSYGSNGYSTNTYYTGSVMAYPNAGDAFTAGMANGMNMGASIRAGQERKQVIQGCMYSLGWTTDKNAVAHASIERAKKKTQAEDFFDIVLSRAQAGDPKMQARAGSAYLQGEDAPKNIEKAIFWLSRASDQGSSEASFQLAYIYAGQVGAQYEDRTLMVLSIQKSAEQGEGIAQSMLGTMYYTGSDGLPKNLDKAIEWYMNACRNNDAMGYLGMGSLYALGQGVEKDPIKAHRFLTRSEELGNTEAADYRKLLEEHMTVAQLREVRLDTSPASSR
ncbi:tetratricopeptide repeat protein [Pseudomonas sp. RP23018S]|uniref:tetratricopeptide repeat protein n=1 Tax=Pseudomonas sp. RP23018S TaxID=3096037 RepID=UPI002ACAAC2F|nr:tetratricopeptide repeat protein [Pseudomonas sp. RP23018S]MDZ5604559.1 tetratricopeptide repeat protein [Pseudomonas sp. RP23018S]